MGQGCGRRWVVRQLAAGAACAGGQHTGRHQPNATETYGARTVPPARCFTSRKQSLNSWREDFGPLPAGPCIPARMRMHRVAFQKHFDVMHRSLSTPGGGGALRRRVRAANLGFGSFMHVLGLCGWL